MKLDILIVDILLVAMVAMPYVAFISVGLKESRKLKKRFMEQAVKYNFRPDRIETWNLNMIGIDQNASTILLLQNYSEGPQVTYLDLKKFRKSNLQKRYQTMRIQKKTEEMLQKVYLELHSFSGENLLVDLYDADKTYQQEYEMRNAEKWNLLINSCLRSRSFSGTAA